MIKHKSLGCSRHCKHYCYMSMAFLCLVYLSSMWYIILQKSLLRTNVKYDSSFSSNDVQKLSSGGTKLSFITFPTRKIYSGNNIITRTMLAKNAPFIWDNKNPSWYNVTYKELPPYDSNLVGNITMDPENIQSLKRNIREHYRRLSNILAQHDLQQLKLWHGFDGAKNHVGRIAKFQDVVVSTDGWIVHTKDNLAVRNGGCVTSGNLSLRKISLKRYNRVFSIALYWSQGIWHFPMEALVGLALLSESEKQNSFIHVSQKNRYVMKWLKLIKVDEKNVIDGTILADTLFVPEVGLCGRPSMEQIQWLRNTILPNVHRTSIRNSVLLIKRTKRRVMPNFNKIQILVENFAKQANLDFIVHDDRSLPSLEIQLERFANSSIVIGPHGAGMVNLIATQRGTCVVEFTPVESNVCYMSLSYNLGLNYVSVPLYRNQTVNIYRVQQALESCQQTRT
ncbi:Hypothetical predicted protein [Mytilus galloprovincialis]|uniref:Glycosyltransferase 61 catalytic domain-containing protein n=2 Tax=Mytilus galloprovincialis TaxID=29158 RepID=A0A8B6GQP4_MYTGA|nr:Hypothetical predicted protein [Mytilus galloprovincialis]